MESAPLPELRAALLWMRFLPAADVRTMVDEVVAAIESATLTGDFTQVAQLLVEWQHTAEIHADPELYRALTAATD